MTTYTKLRTGAWGLRVAGEMPVAGMSVTVTKRDGSAKSEVIARVLWTGEDKKNGGTVHLCAIQQSERPAARREYREPSWRGNGCSECRRRGDWCDSCAFDEFDN